MLGYNYLNLILDDWQRVFQKEEERVVDFKVRVCTYLRALGINMLQKLEDQKQIKKKYGGQEIVGLLDTGSSHFLVKKEIFEKMEGKEVVAPTSYKGVEGGLVQQQKGKLVKMSNLLWGDRLYSLPSVGPIGRRLWSHCKLVWQWGWK